MMMDGPAVLFVRAELCDRVSNFYDLALTAACQVVNRTFLTVRSATLKPGPQTRCSRGELQAYIDRNDGSRTKRGMPNPSSSPWPDR